MSWWRLRRLYRLHGLEVRPQRKRRVRYVRGSAITVVSRPNERWSIDFVHDRLALDRPIRATVVVDDFTRECLALDIGFSFASRDVSRALEVISFERDRGTEFTSRAMLQWSAERGIALRLSDPGKPQSARRIAQRPHLL